MDQESLDLLRRLQLFIDEYVKVSEKIQGTLEKLNEKGIFGIEVTIRPIRVDKTNKRVQPNALNKRFVQ